MTENKKMTRIACVGDSITLGYGIGYESDTYPGQLDQLLGPDYEVLNFGFNGATVSKLGDKPYLDQEVGQRALKSQADIILIMLGTNDSKEINWRPETFREDYQTLIDLFRELSHHPRLILMQAPKVFTKVLSGQDCNNEALKEIHQMVNALAEDNDLETIDLYHLTENHPKWLWDGLHPTEKGTAAFAQTIFDYLSQNKETGHATAR